MAFLKQVLFLMALVPLSFTSMLHAQKRSAILLELRSGLSLNPRGSSSGTGGYPFYLLDEKVTASANVGLAAGYSYRLASGVDLSLAGVMDLYLGGDVVPVVSAEPKLTLGTGRTRPFIFLNVGKALYSDPIASGGSLRHGGGPGSFNTYGDAVEERIDKNALLWGAGLGVHIRVLRFTGLMAGLKYISVPSDVMLEKSVQQYYGGPYIITNPLAELIRI